VALRVRDHQARSCSPSQALCGQPGEGRTRCQMAKLKSFSWPQTHGRATGVEAHPSRHEGAPERSSQGKFFLVGLTCVALLAGVAVFVVHSKSAASMRRQQASAAAAQFLRTWASGNLSALPAQTVTGSAAIAQAYASVDLALVSGRNPSTANAHPSPAGLTAGLPIKVRSTRGLPPEFLVRSCLPPCARSDKAAREVHAVNRLLRRQGAVARLLCQSRGRETARRRVAGDVRSTM
jgi:hypothetical protein